MKKKKQQTISKNNKNPNSNPDIAYQNKDIVSKLFGEQMKGKSLSFIWFEYRIKSYRYSSHESPIIQGERTSDG